MLRENYTTKPFAHLLCDARSGCLRWYMFSVLDHAQQIVDGFEGLEVFKALSITSKSPRSPDSVDCQYLAASKPDLSRRCDICKKA